MFDKAFTFKGTHAKKVNELTNQINKDGSKAKIFKSNIEIYILAPIIGFLYGRKSESNNIDEESAKIMPETIINFKEELKFNLRLIILLDEENESNKESRINNAFKYWGDKELTEHNLRLFNSYVLGGVDILYKKIIEPNNRDYISNIYDFIEEFYSRYNSVSENNPIDSTYVNLDS